MREVAGRSAGEPGVRRDGFPLGAAVTMDELDGELHPLLRRLRTREPVSWVPALGGWLVTSRDLALRVLRDSRAFTVDDPRFSTARVVGPSMLSLDGAEHKRHRDPFAEAGPLAVAVVAEVLGLGEADPAVILSWYDSIVAAVSALAGDSGQGSGAAGAVGAQAFGMLRASLEGVISSADGGSLLAAAAGAGGLRDGEVVSNAAVLMFGGIETIEGMICNAVLHLLGHPAQLREVGADERLAANAVEESLRLEPAAAVVDRYATADVQLGPAAVRHGDLVTVSLAGACRDPAFFPDPDRFDVHRENARQHLAFANGPHFCLGAHLARVEARAAIVALLRRLPGLRLDPVHPAAPRGVVFRKPPALHVLWDAATPPGSSVSPGQASSR